MKINTVLHHIAGDLVAQAALLEEARREHLAESGFSPKLHDMNKAHSLILEARQILANAVERE